MTPVESLFDDEIFKDPLTRRGLDVREPRLEMYNVDLEIFKTLFTELTVWKRCQGVDLAEKLFQVSDFYQECVGGIFYGIIVFAAAG